MAKRLRTCATIAGAALLAGCTSIGAQRMGIDRADFSNHLRTTNKEQLLTNIVALRYGDQPLFLDVSSVISQYSREGTLHGDMKLGPVNVPEEGSVGGTVLLRETPTITYTPLSGDRFARSILSPISPVALMSMIGSGWSADYLLLLSARSINGVSNGGWDELVTLEADPDFDRVLAAMGRLQRSRALVFHIDRGEGTSFTSRVQLSQTLTDAQRADVEFLIRMFKVPAGRGDIPIVFGPAKTAPRQLAIGTRSLFEILLELAHGVEIPNGSQQQAMPTSSLAAGRKPLIRIRSGADKPIAPHVAIRHNGYWYWIDGNDSASKRTFLMAQILLSLNDTSGGASGPLVTVPVG